MADFTQRSQFSDRLRQLAGARFQFLEQPHVLDGDHGLVGEGFKELDLLIGKRTNFRSADDDRTDGNTLAQQWCGKNGPSSRNCLRGSDFGKLGFSSAARS